MAVMWRYSQTPSISALWAWLLEEAAASQHALLSNPAYYIGSQSFGLTGKDKETTTPQWPRLK